MVVLLVSVAALILVSAGIALHVWRHHARRNDKTATKDHSAAIIPDELDVEVETEEAP